MTYIFTPICQFCKQEFTPKPQTAGKYCSYGCYWNSKKGNSECAKNFGEYAKVGNDLAWNKNLKGYKTGSEHWCYKKKRPEITGDKHPNWKGGTAKYRNDLRYGADYIHWRSEVFERDNYTCQKCGDDRGRNLEAHHISCWSDCPELRFELNNGVTLCIDCHYEITWGRKR